MIILRQKEFSSEEYLRAKKKFPGWSEKKIQTYLKFQAKADDYINKMGEKTKKARTSFIKKPVHFSNTSKNQYEQKIFFDYSKYTDEEAAKIRAERHKTAELLNEERKIAKFKFDSKQKLAKTHFTPMTSDAPEEAAKLINKRDKMIGDAMKSRNEAYEDALKRSEARRRAIEDNINKPKENKIKNATSPTTNKVQEKAGGFIKKAWNGEIGMGKTGNRAAMIGVPILAVGGTALALRKKNKKEE